jgi:hypothetical protein
MKKQFMYARNSGLWVMPGRLRRFVTWPVKSPGLGESGEEKVDLFFYINQKVKSKSFVKLCQALQKANLFHSEQQATFTPVGRLRADFEQAFHNYTREREALWDVLDTACAKQRQVEVELGFVREWLEKAGFPLDILKIPQGASLYDYVKWAVKWWSEDRKVFFEFCLLLYRPQGDCPLLTPSEFEKLDGRRRTLAKFWDEWEVRCNGQDTSLGDMLRPDLIQSQTPDVAILAYLEMARGFLQQEDLRGK